MKITRLIISNFRSFGPEPASVELSGSTCFVGTNGSGKSVVLIAMCKLFGLSEAERTIVKSDFHVSDDKEEKEPEERSLTIEVRLEFPELKDEEGSAYGQPVRCRSFCQRESVKSPSSLCRAILSQMPLLFRAKKASAMLNEV
jgi:predicted ATP-dependent endonuclease of OLD family